VRLEQFYPFPEEQVRRVVESYPDAEVVWVQDEPENQGAWPFVHVQLGRVIPDRQVRVVSRPAAASPAAGSSKRHATEQTDLIARATAE
jgi:2-oxoglutarate decarboxylase